MLSQLVSKLDSQLVRQLVRQLIKQLVNQQIGQLVRKLVKWGSVAMLSQTILAQGVLVGWVGGRVWVAQPAPAKSKLNCLKMASYCEGVKEIVVLAKDWVMPSLAAN